MAGNTGKTILPDPFPLTDDLRQWANVKVPTLDIDYYHEEFCDHWYANGKMMKSWKHTWQNWMRRTDNGSAPGVWLDKVRRKRPRPVPDRHDTPMTAVEEQWQRLDRLRNEAVRKGMTPTESRQKTVPELRAFIGGAA